MGGKTTKKVKSHFEKSARVNVIEELFYDFNRNRAQVYWMNFTRGIFFGLGTILGSTVIIAIIIWTLSQFTNWFPATGQYLERLIEALQAR